jgi:phosphate transport system substrate-binding protein
MIFNRFFILLSAMMVEVPLISAQATTCGATGTISLAGSVNVQPIATLWAAAYKAQCNRAVTVEGGGSSTGALRVCGDTTKGSAVDIGNLARGWKSTEAKVGTNGYTYTCLIGTKPSVVQVDVAIDALAVVTKLNGAEDLCIKALGGLTNHQLRWIFSNYTVSKLKATGWNAASLPNSDGNDSTHLWSELSTKCPKTEIKLSGTDSTLASYTNFIDAILTDSKNGEGIASSRYKAFAVEANVITYIKSSASSVAFVGYGLQYNKNRSVVNAAAIKNSAGSFVLPTSTTIQNGTYNPLSRRIFMNVKTTTLTRTKAYIQYGMSTKGTADVTTAGFIPIPATDRTKMLTRVSNP